MIAHLADGPCSRACQGVLNAAGDDGEQDDVGVVVVVGELEPEEVDDVADGGEGEEAPLLLPHLPRPALERFDNLWRRRTDHPLGREEPTYLLDFWNKSI